MPGIILPGRWTSQPQYPIGLDWGNPLSRELVSVINPGGFADAVGRTPLLVNGTINKSGTKNGVSTFASTSGGAHSVAGVATGITFGALTDFVLVQDYVQIGGSTFLYGCGTYDGTNACGITLEHSGIANNWGAVDIGSGLLNNLASSGESLPSGSQFLVHSRDGTNHRFYRNGVLRNTVAGGSGNAGPTARFVQNNLQQSGGTFSTVAKIALSGRFKRALSDVEVAELSENPWALFQPKTRRIFFDLGAGGGSTSLVIADSTHGHAADALSLSTDWLLTVQDALHAHTADSLTLSVSGSTDLVVADAAHAHAADAVILSTDWLLAIADAIHAHAADALVLDTSNQTLLTIADATHGHTADSIILTTDSWLAIADALHAHAADAVTLDLASVALIIADVLHEHRSDIVVLSLPGSVTLTPDDLSAIADAVVNKLLGARTLGAHIQAIAAAALGETTGAGTSHMTFTDGPVTVEADVPLPGVAGDRTNVVITGV